MIKGRVYVVDDEEEVRDSALFLLAANGYGGRAFPTGDEFLVAVPALEPGCVLLDFRMPGRSGLEVLAALRSMAVAWPVLVMSGDDGGRIAPAAMRHGAFAFLDKPFEPDMLLQILDRAFASGPLAPPPGFGAD